MAQLVYPPSKEEISRKHLSIRFDEKTNKFILEDSSSNGTFLSSNQKLESGKPYYLNAGDRFYVADPKEVFELKMGKE
jgi:pSer/pThr/pTyr-binding forkhead associated (FHA) protein